MRSWIRRTGTNPAGEDGSGLILVFLVMLVSSALSLVLLEGAVSLSKQTQANNKRVTSLTAAQAGLDAALAQVRDATDPLTGEGDVNKIPCTVAAGTVGGVTSAGAPVSNSGSYTVSVSYYSQDPTGQSAAWRGDSSKQINCPSGNHPDQVPAYALVSATGLSAAGKPRTIESTYIFKTSNKNIAGGLLHVEGGGEGSVPDLCPDAGSAHPAIGDVVKMATCNTSSSAQRWAYQKDLSFLLTSTSEDATPMCMSAAGSPASNGTVLKIDACTGQPNGSSVTLQQQFSYDDNGRFENSKVNSSGSRTLAGTCMNVTSANTIGSTLTIGSCGQVWRPEAAVGAGMSGDGVNVGVNTQQLVNFSEFGRCLDATGQNPDADYMIAYPCKQSPSPSEITWNQKYSFNSSTGSISTYDTSNSTTYCLTSPMSAELDVTVVGPFVTLKKCVSPLTTNMKWTEIGNDPTKPYEDQYTIRDASNPNLCLGVGQPGGGTRTASGLGEWSTPYVQVCDGSAGQKWNAPPNTGTGSVTGINEVSPGG
jgi:Tfp pilus assembly protein PilX